MRLEDFYRNILGLTDQGLISEAVKASGYKTLRQGEYLIRQGIIPTRLYFLLQGIVRGFMLDVNGRDITDCICFRCGEPIMPDNDFTQPASITIEALEDCEIVYIPLTVVEDLLQKYPSLWELYQRFLLHSANMHRELKIATYQYSAVQRYQWFLEKYPGLIDQVPHKYIASLLNMTPVTLSKMRKILKENGEKLLPEQKPVAKPGEKTGGTK